MKLQLELYHGDTGINEWNILCELNPTEESACNPMRERHPPDRSLTHRNHLLFLIMNKRENARHQAFQDIAAFGTANAAILADATADTEARKKAKAKARTKFGEMKTIAKDIGDEDAKQKGGTTAQANTSRSVLRDALRTDLGLWAETADAISDELGRPEIMDRFRLPHGNNDPVLTARARAFITAVADLGLHNAFVEQGMEEDFEDELVERIEEFEGSSDDQSNAGSTETGAGSKIDTLVDKGMTVRKLLNSLIRNLFKKDSEIIGAWSRAHHVDRQGSRKKKDDDQAGGGTTPAPKP